MYGLGRTWLLYQPRDKGKGLGGRPGGAVYRPPSALSGVRLKSDDVMSVYLVTLSLVPGHTWSHSHLCLVTLSLVPGHTWSHSHLCLATPGHTLTCAWPHLVTLSLVPGHTWSHYHLCLVTPGHTLTCTWSQGWTPLSYSRAKGKYGPTEEKGIYPEVGHGEWRVKGWVKWGWGQ